MKHRIRSVSFVVLLIATGLLHGSPAVGAAGKSESRKSVTVSFGAGLNTAIGINPANHHIVPPIIRVDKGGVVNFVVAGFHQIFIYNPGVKPADLTVPAFPPNLFINDFNNLYYEGLNPAGATEALAGGQNPGSPQVNRFNRSNVGNRVESVSFAAEGRYLVICNINPHFRDGMIAWIVVGDDDHDDDDEKEQDQQHGHHK